MKRSVLFLYFFLVGFICHAQNMNIKEITGLLDLNSSKLESYLQRKGFKRDFVFSRNDNNGVSFMKMEKSKSDTTIRGFQVVGGQSNPELVYRTSSLDEFSRIAGEIQSSDFVYPSGGTETGKVLYQKESLAFETSTIQLDSTTFYVLKAAKKILPKRKDILWAEDLLQLDAHEYLVEVFGKSNVRSDNFYYSPTDSNKCTVLFPRTNMEVIFIWEDQINLRDISFIVIGGSLHEAGNIQNINQISQNAWRSRQGAYCGMSLRELHQLNESPVRFFNWHTESAGYLAPKNKGQIDFDKLGVVLNCLNCGFIESSSTDIVDSQVAIQESQKVYVTTLIILPEKRTDQVHK